MPLRRTINLLLIALAIGSAIGCKRGEKVPDGDIASSLTAQVIGAYKFDPAQLKGKPSIVMFVTPTCPHCLATLPRGDAAAKATGANCVAVFVAGREENAAGVISHTKFSGTAMVDDGTLSRKYNVRRVPYTLVLGPDGHAHDAFIGEQDESTLRDAIADAR